jgi:SHS family lactate transporter-like MFS transporter
LYFVASGASISYGLSGKLGRPMAMSSETSNHAFPQASGYWHTVVACFLGWTLDAFDFFVVVFLVGTLADGFNVSKTAIVWTLTITLATRPAGAFLFGLLADRYGRRNTLMANVAFYSMIELLCGFAPSFTVFIILRALYGLGMGGEWGIGASLTMETVPRRWRGILSGVLQSGYPIGYLLAAVAARFILPMWGWRAMFWIGAAPALLVLYIRAGVPESKAWLQHREADVTAILRTVGRHWKSFLYLVLMMTLMMFLSHGTQDLYPDFLKSARQIKPSTVSDIAVLYNLGAVLGSIFFGYLSERIGRRRSMLGAIGVALVVIPFWAFGGSIGVLTAGAFLMQMGVQGAWGIIPAHLSELSPDSVRGLLPGLAYHLGILIAAPTNTIEYALRDWVGYGWAMAGFETMVIVVLGVVVALGGENRGKDFLAPARPVTSSTSGSP